jgi:hypothetical protein
VPRVEAHDASDLAYPSRFLRFARRPSSPCGLGSSAWVSRWCARVRLQVRRCARVGTRAFFRFSLSRLPSPSSHLCRTRSPPFSRRVPQYPAFILLGHASVVSVSIAALVSSCASRVSSFYLVQGDGLLCSRGWPTRPVFFVLRAARRRPAAYFSLCGPFFVAQFFHALLWRLTACMGGLSFSIIFNVFT